MDIKTSKKSIITEIGEGILSTLHIKYLKSLLEREDVYRVGIDFSRVDSVSVEFLDFIKHNVVKGELSFYNVGADLYVLMFIMKMDRYINFYMSESDFLKDRQCIVNRRLRLCS